MRFSLDEGFVERGKISDALCILCPDWPVYAVPEDRGHIKLKGIQQSRSRLDELFTTVLHLHNCFLTVFTQFNHLFNCLWFMSCILPDRRS